LRALTGRSQSDSNATVPNTLKTVQRIYIICLDIKSSGITLLQLTGVRQLTRGLVIVSKSATRNHLWRK